MRILHIEKSMPAAGGIGAYIDALEARQRAAGHEVLRFGAVQEPSRTMPRFVDFAASRRPLDWPRMVHNNEAAARLAEFLRRRPVEVAHLHNIYHHLTPSILPVLNERRVAVVMTVHDYRLACPAKFLSAGGQLCTRCLPNRFHHASGRRCLGLRGAALAAESYIQRLARRYLGRVDLFLCPTRFMADTLRRLGVAASKLAVVPNPLPPEPQAPAQDPMPQASAEAEGANELLFFGRLAPEKNPRLMLDLARMLRDVPVTIVGGGPRREALEAEARGGSLANVTFAGPVDRSAAGAFFARAAAVVITSGCMENSPAAMLEAMAAGRCVIVPDQPPLREWIADGRTGRLYAHGDAASLAAAARAVLADPASAAAMADEGRRLVLARHDGAAVAAAVEDCYRKARRSCASRW